MALMPKRVKYRKSQRGKMKCNAARANYVAFGEYGLQSLEQCWLEGKTIEAGRVAATHYLQREGKVYIRVFPAKPVSAKPLETRMGKGKGQPEHWVATIRPGNILFELDGIPESIARESLRLAATKLPVRTKFITRHHAVA